MRTRKKVGRPPLPEQERRSVYVNFRLTPWEMARLQRHVRPHETQNVTARRLVLRAVLSSSPDPE